MRTVIPGQANPLIHAMVRGSDSQPLTVGTVYFYVLATTGTHAWQWWDGTGWTATETPAGVGTHVSQGLWKCPVAAEAWTPGVAYEVYAVDAGHQCVVYSEQMVPLLSVGAVGVGDHAWTYTLRDSLSGSPIPDATIRVSSDAAGQHVLYKAVTDAAGQVQFHLPVGMTVYVWREKVGYDFEDPDVEVVD